MRSIDKLPVKEQGLSRTLAVSGFVVLAAYGCFMGLTMPSSTWAGGMCPDSPSGGGQTMSASATTQTNCSVTSGMYVRPFTTLRLDAIATANGQCQIVLPQCTGAGCVCVPSSTVEERTINHISSWVNITSQNLNGTYTVGSVYGKNPVTGMGMFLHVLDTTQPNSTGPLTYGIPSPGQYALHFQANINTTACNIQPNVTPQVDIMVYARTTLHRGERSNGSLVGGMSLPDPGPGYYQDPVGDVKNQDDWGGAEAAILLIQTVGGQWFQNHPTPRIGILDISKAPSGGPFPPHEEHQNGLDIDVRYIRTDGAEQALNLADPNQKPLFDKAKTIELLRLFANNGSLYRILVSPLAGITSADVPGANIVELSGHDNHFHVSLNDPDGSDGNNCL